MEPNDIVTSTTAEDADLAVGDLIEEVSIDGMCGVY
jgi:mycofactocin precursor